mgnify:FL=1
MTETNEVRGKKNQISKLTYTDASTNKVRERLTPHKHLTWSTGESGSQSTDQDAVLLNHCLKISLHKI